VLVVGQDHELLHSTLEAIRKQLPPESEIHVCATAREAKELYLRGRFGAVLVDQVLSDGTGTSLLRSLLMFRGRSSNLFLIGPRNTEDSESVQLLRDHPEVYFIERPYRADVIARQVRNAIAPRPVTEQSFYGLRLMELIQAFALGRKSASIVVLMADNRMGNIFIREGQIVHATLGREEGIPALEMMFQSKKGEIRILNDCTTARETITKPTQQVILDIYRRMDERKHGTDAGKAASESAREKTQPPPVMQPAPSASESPRTPADDPAGAIALPGLLAGVQMKEEEQFLKELDAMFDAIADPVGGTAPSPSLSPSPSAAPSALSPPSKQPEPRPSHSLSRQDPGRLSFKLTEQPHVTRRGPLNVPTPPGSASRKPSVGSASTSPPSSLPPKSIFEMIEEALEE
jgi:DNA-binding NarL/FixJ family response regulator